MKKTVKNSQKERSENGRRRAARGRPLRIPAGAAKNRTAAKPSAAPSRVTSGEAVDAKAKAFPIVGLGASAGGLDAFTQLLKHLPADTGMGFVLVQHLDPTHDSGLTEILSRATAMRVQEVTDDLRVEPNQVYVIPPNTCMEISRGTLR